MRPATPAEEVPVAIERSGEGVERATGWWVASALWSLVVFATIPFARSLQWTVQDRLGRAAFGWGVLLAVTLGVLGTIAWLRRRGLLRSWRLLFVAVPGGIFAAATISLRAAPEEALHFVEYGVLGVLLWRALRPALPDAGSFLGAALLGGALGTIDEAIQWATPRRFWGLRDIGLNLFAASLVQVILAGAVAPELARRRPGPASTRRLCRIASAVLLVFAASLLNTPTRTAWLAEHLPGLEGLRNSVMAEYGHLHVDPEIGRFRSRLDAEALREADATRASEGAALLNPYALDYQRFLDEHPASADPFVHEARVHLFRRDRYRAIARDAAEGSPERRQAATVALGEQRILERYFGRTLAASSYVLSEAERAWLVAAASTRRDYESAVSADVITAFGEAHVVVGTLLGLACLAAVAVRTRPPLTSSGNGSRRPA